MLLCAITLASGERLYNNMNHLHTKKGFGFLDFGTLWKRMIASYRKVSSRGFTLIELLLYISLIAIFITAAISFSLDIVYGREKAYQNMIVDQSARIALAKISYEVRRAKNIISLTDNQIILDDGDGTTTIELTGSTLVMTTEGSGPFNLTSNQVIVDATNPIFKNSGSTDNNSKNISV